jgi:TonB family protein
MLGAIYAEEKNPAQDNVEAYKWLILCAFTGEGEKQITATNSLVNLTQKMTPQQIKKAEQQVIKHIETHAHKAGNDIYLSGGGVTAPVALEKPTPPYTEQARAADISGKVIVACIVRKTGNVDNCEIQRGLGHGLDESAINTIETRWRFQPGRILYKPVDIFARIQITFNPK